MLFCKLILYSHDKIGETCSSEGNYKQSLKDSGRKPEVWGKFTLFLMKYLAMKEYGGGEVRIFPFSLPQWSSLSGRNVMGGLKYT